MSDNFFSYAYLDHLKLTSDKIKREFFQVVTISVLLYGCTTWTRTKRLKKKLNKQLKDTALNKS